MRCAGTPQYGGVQGAAIQVFRNAALSAPTSFRVLAFLRQAVRLACFAAASPEIGPAGAFAAAAGALLAGASVLGAAANPPATADMLRQTAAAMLEYRIPPRIAPAVNRSHEARMKLA